MSNGFNAQARRGFSIVSFIIGIVVGGGIASAVLGFLLVEQQRQHAEALSVAAMNVGFKAVDAAGQLIDQKINKTNGKKLTVEEQIVETGKSFVDDLEKNRLLKVHRSMTAEYQVKNPVEMFTSYTEKYGSVRSLDSLYREHYVRKLPKDRGYEFYFTGKVRFNSDLVNIAMILKDVDGEWLIDDLQISQPQK